MAEHLPSNTKRAARRLQATKPARVPLGGRPVYAPDEGKT